MALENYYCVGKNAEDLSCINIQSSNTSYGVRQMERKS